MFRVLLLSALFTLAAAQDPVQEPGDDVIEREITEVIVEEQPVMLLGELELRRLEPYFVKQAWNWQQLYDAQCTRNPHPGSCTQSLTRWFFYPTFGKCYAFVYGGCGGTANRFASQSACLKSCVPLQKPMRPPPVVDEATLAPPPDTGVLNALLSQRDNETEEAVQRLAQPVTVPSTSTSSAATLSAATATGRTDRPKAKREFVPDSREVEVGLYQDALLHLDRIIL